MDESPQPDAEAPADPWLHLYPETGRQAREWLAVLESQRLPYHLDRGDAVWVIHVPPSHAETARRQIDLYEEDVRNWPHPPAPGSLEASDEPSFLSLTVALVLLLVFARVGPYDAASPVFRAGEADAAAILSGEVYRALTALFLHADFAHVAANALCALLLGSLVARRLGDGTAWLLILLSGVAGNLTNAAFYAHSHISVGASTAVFGILGLLGALQIAENLRRGTWAWRSLLVPLGCVVMLFVLIGTGDEAGRTDVAAHLWGTMWGVALGVPAAQAVGWRENLRWQAGCSLAALSLAVLAWAWALHGF